MKAQSSKSRLLLMGVCLVAAIIAIYWPVYKFDFVKYDDDVYVTDNKNIQSGFSLKNIQWAFTSGYASNWHPLTWFSHTLDYLVYKDFAGGHHITNILLHIANTLLLFYFLKKATDVIWPAVFVAAAFAVHPLHVESVAWIAERKDVLSTFFWLLTMIAYVNYAGGHKIKWYLSAFVFFVFGLMSKPMLVTLPFVLLLLDYWPLARKISPRLFVEKIPFFICSVISCVVTFCIQHKSGAISDIEVYGLKTRIGNVIISYADYILKMIWPNPLAILYPYPAKGLPTAKVIISAIILLLISIYFIWLARRHKFVLFGWLWYLGTLVPVIGLVQVGAHAIADRYTYMPLTGLFIIIAFGIKEFVKKKNYKLFGFLAVVIIIIWSILAFQQVKYWKDSLTLFEHTLKVTGTNFIIHANYTACLNDIGRYSEAIEESKLLIAMKPESPEVRNDFGCGLMNAGRYNEALEQLHLALKYKPEFPQAYYNLGNTLKKLGDYNEATVCYQRAIELKPDYIDAYLNLAIAFNEQHKFQQALDICDKEMKFDFDNVFVHGYRAMAMAGLGKTTEAIDEVRYVLKFRPNDVEMYRNLGILLIRNGQTAEAIKVYRQALRIDPNDKNTKLLLDTALKNEYETK